MAAANSDSWWQWLVQVNDVSKLWEAQPDYLISQAVYILAGVVTFLHALDKGGRWPYFWIGTVLHGLYADNFWHFALPEYDNFWHSQTPIMLLGARLPLHIILLYPAFIYQSAYAISKLNLPRYAEPFAVGLLVVLIDLPYDITAVKFVHWTWHDTDPNIYDRHYWVPWNSYYFHTTFAASFYFFFHLCRSPCAPSEPNSWQAKSKYVEWKSVITATFFGMPGGVLLFVPIYHPLHDMWKVHSEVTFFMLAAICGSIILHGLMNRQHGPKQSLSKMDYLLITQLVVHYIIYWVFVVFYNPEKQVSVGLHEPVGPCAETATLTTPFGQTLTKRKYFCPELYDEGYFDFHCVKEKPAHGASWYTICGTPFENRTEYIVVISTIIIFAAGVFYSIYFSPSKKVEDIKKKQKTEKKQKTK